MPFSRGISFSSGIRKICSAVHPSMTLTGGALKLTAKLIENLNETLVSRCQRKFKHTKKKGVMKGIVASNAVNEVCDGNIKTLAVAEGNKCILKYNCGLLQYNPKKDRGTSIFRAKKKAKDKARKQNLGTEYSKGVSNLTKLVFPEASLHTTGKQMACRLLGELSKRIGDSARTSGQEAKMITTNEVKTAVESILPDELRKHALAEGAKMVFFQESGRISFTPTKRRVVRRLKEIRQVRAPSVTPKVITRKLTPTKKPRKPAKGKKIRKADSLTKREPSETRMVAQKTTTRSEKISKSRAEGDDVFISNALKPGIRRLNSDHRPTPRRRSDFPSHPLFLICITSSERATVGRAISLAMGGNLSKALVALQKKPADASEEPLEDPPTPPAPDPRLPLTARQLFNISKSWKGIARAMEPTGITMFVRLFEENEDILHLFQKFQYKRIHELHRDSMELAQHAGIVMNTLDESIKKLDNVDLFMDYLHTVGMLHTKIPGFQRDYFWRIERPFLAAVQDTLGDRYTDNMENIYKITIRYILDTVVKGFDLGCQQSESNAVQPPKASPEPSPSPQDLKECPAISKSQGIIKQ